MPSPPAALRHALETEWVAPSTLTPWSRNPRRNDAAAKRLAVTIEAHGWTTPVLVQSGSGRVIAGHTRLKAAALLGLDRVPVVRLDVDDRQADEIAIADNRLGELAEWDADGLAELLREFVDDDLDIGALGWADDELAELLAAVTAPGEDEWSDALAGLPDEDRAPFRQMTFTVHDDQHEQIEAALRAAKADGPFDSPNENSNGNALARLAETFLTVRRG